MNSPDPAGWEETPGQTRTLEWHQPAPIRQAQAQRNLDRYGRHDYHPGDPIPAWDCDIDKTTNRYVDKSTEQAMEQRQAVEIPSDHA